MKTLNKCLLLLALLPVAANADRYIAKGNDTAIIDNVCLYSTAGPTRVTDITSEDAGLEIVLTSSDHATQLIYDAAAEIEGITTLGTWAAPSANNVRFDDDTVTGCYELQFAADSFEDGTSAMLSIRDTSTPTFADYDLTIQVWASGYFDILDGTESVITSRDLGTPLITTIDGVTNQTTLSLAAGPTNDDALNNLTAYIKGGTEECFVRVTDYTASGNDITIGQACPNFTVATSDEISFLHGAEATVNYQNKTTLSAIDGKTDTLVTEIGTATGADLAADIAAVKAETALIVADTGVIGTPAGADIAADIAAVKVDTAATLVDTAVIGSPAGADIAADIAAVKADTAATLVDTAEIGSAAGADIAADIAAVKVDTAAILDDTGTSGVVIPTDGITSAQIGNTAAGEIADAVLKEVLADHSATVGSAAEALEDIKAKTDNLTFGTYGVDAETEAVNDCEITGDGNATPFDSGC